MSLPALGKEIDFFSFRCGSCHVCSHLCHLRLDYCSIFCEAVLLINQEICSGCKMWSPPPCTLYYVGRKQVIMGFHNEYCVVFYFKKNLRMLVLTCISSPIHKIAFSLLIWFQLWLPEALDISELLCKRTVHNNHLLPLEVRSFQQFLLLKKGTYSKGSLGGDFCPLSWATLQKKPLAR